MPNIWTFEDTGRAYDCSQSSDVIKDGDILVAIRDRVVGFLCQAWPVAVTDTTGHFHRARNDNYGGLNADRTPDCKADYVESAKMAKDEIARLESLAWDVPETDHEILYPDFYANLRDDEA